MSDMPTPDTLPTSFGAFKPVGYLMVGLPAQVAWSPVIDALVGAGWAGDWLLPFRPGESADEIETMIRDAGGLAGFGYEITLMRRYFKLTLEGYQWLLAKVDSTEQAAQAAEIVRAQGATLAIHYRMLITEELI